MNFIKKINKYLLEHYPLIWNTRLVWMTGVGVLLHLIFFIVGYTFVNNQADISSEYRLDKFYFDNSVVFVGILTSIIILLVWIIYFLQNNAFKNLYHLKKGTLFKQFCFILFIVFINITQYYSFDQGLKLKIRNSYDWAEIDKDIKEWNRLSIFLLQKSSEYNIDHKQYPVPFPLENSSDKDYLGASIDTTKSYFKYGDRYYQFYKLDKAQMDKDYNELNDENRDHTVYYDKRSYRRGINSSNNFKYRTVYDISKYHHLIKESLLNYSAKLYRYGQDSSANKKRLNYYENLLNKKDEKEIEKAIIPFFNLAKKYAVKHNLNLKDWLYLINTSDHYFFKEKIYDRKFKDNYYSNEEKKAKLNYYRYITLIDTVSLKNKDEKHKLFLSRYPVTKDGKSALVERVEKEYFKEVPYCDLGNLDHFFKNVHESYNPEHNKDRLYVFIVISFIIGLLLFLFKITDIKTLLLSFVAGGVLLIILVLLLSNSRDYLVSLFGRDYGEIIISIGMGIIVLIASFLAFKLQWKKLITAILFSLSLFIVPLLFTASFALYSIHLRKAYNIKTNSFIVWFEAYGFWLIMSLWLVSIVLYLLPIRKWKGLPE